jgi:hypothetical protein
VLHQKSRTTPSKAPRNRPVLTQGTIPKESKSKIETAQKRRLPFSQPNRSLFPKRGDSVGLPKNCLHRLYPKNNLCPYNNHTASPRSFFFCIYREMERLLQHRTLRRSSVVPVLQYQRSSIVASGRPHWGGWLSVIEKCRVLRHDGAPTWPWACLYGKTDACELIFLGNSGDLRSTALLCSVVSTQMLYERLRAFRCYCSWELTLESPVASGQLGLGLVSIDASCGWLFSRKNSRCKFEHGKCRHNGSYSFLEKIFVDVIIPSADMIYLS